MLNIDNFSSASSFQTSKPCLTFTEGVDWTLNERKDMSVSPVFEQKWSNALNSLWMILLYKVIKESIVFYL